MEFSKTGFFNSLKALLEQSFNYLGTRKPLITISDVNKKAFKRIIEKYEWELKQILPNYYKQGVTEYVYNGILLSEEEHMKLLEANLRSEIKKRLLKKNVKTKNIRK